MSDYILGISCYYHDSSAALLKDGRIVAACEEERFTRIKHDTSFPINAIAFCLDRERITIKNIRHIAFYEKPFLKFERILSQHLQCFPFSFPSFYRAVPTWINEKLRVLRTVRKNLRYGGDVFFVEHHMAHAASAFLVSPFDRAAILTIDGVGEWATTTYGTGNGTDIRLVKEIRFPSSMGLMYSAITAYLGFRVNNSEYKVMGLAAYGNMDRKTNPYYDKLRGTIDVKEDGSYCLDMENFIYHCSGRMPSKKLCRLLGGDVREPEDEITQRHKDIAAALQLVYEDVFFLILRHVHKETGLSNIVLAGGCALNSVANGKILQNSPFLNVWVQPNASDGGSSIGAAAYAYHCILKNDRTRIMNNAYLGPSFTTEEIKLFLDDNGIRYTIFHDDNDLVCEAAARIFKNEVVGWFQGRAEWGPRALGSRSILANPCNPEAMALLNEKVKHREKFRPFAPAVCEEDVGEYFEADTPLSRACRFMLMVYPVKKKWREKIPSVTHVDGSGRIQAVDGEHSPLFHRVIKSFGAKSGIPVVINTSFNIRGEPIVNTPADAYRCMMGTGIDCLFLDKFLIERANNPEDMWDSEETLAAEDS